MPTIIWEECVFWSFWFSISRGFTQSSPKDILHFLRSRENLTFWNAVWERNSFFVSIRWRDLRRTIDVLIYAFACAIYSQRKAIWSNKQANEVDNRTTHEKPRENRYASKCVKYSRVTDRSEWKKIIALIACIISHFCRRRIKWPELDYPGRAQKTAIRIRNIYQNSKMHAS